MEILIMKKTTFWTATFLLFGMLLMWGTPAHAIELNSYTVGIRVQNLSTNEATVAMTFYKQDGDGVADAVVNDTIAADSGNTYFPLPSQVEAGFSGSAVISSNQPIAAVTNVLGDNNGTSLGGAYSGLANGSQTVSLPIIMKGNFGIDTWFNVQNAGSAQTTITVSYAGQPTCDETATIDPGTVKTFNQATNTCLPEGYVNGATVTAATGGSIVATALQVGTGGVFAYNGFASGSQSPIMPLINANNFGIVTGMSIQNTSTSASTDVTVSYTAGSAGANCTETRTIAAGASETFALYAFSFSEQNPPAGASSTCSMGNTFVGGARVTSNSGNAPLVTIVNQTILGKNGSAYAGFDPGTATTTVKMPIIIDAYGINSGYTVMNVGTDATITCSYAGLDSSFNQVSGTVANGGVYGNDQFNTGFPANTSGGYVGSGTCTASTGGLLVGIVNQVNLSASGDSTFTYEAFNQ